VIVMVVDEQFVARVEAIVREVARTEILPRFGRLEQDEIVEKGPGDLVTVADRAAERALSEALTALWPGSRVVGEEAVFADPALLGALDESDPVWIIDPIDGTSNYAAGNTRFSVLVALARKGELLASWIYEPWFDRMAHAVRGAGAFLDGARLRVADAPDPAAGLRDLEIATSRPGFWSARARAAITALSTHGVSVSYSDGAGLEYLAMASGRRGSALMVWENVWDHAAGLLLHSEAGGASVCLDGEPFRLAGGNALPFAVAPDPATARAIIAGCTTRLERPSA
jgi:fructose-1,6-bisphosphatase/inositol monophosphatase family enzyme